MNLWLTLALDGVSGFAGGWLAYRLSSKLIQSKLLLVFFGIGIAYSACLVLPYASIPSPITPAVLWKPLVHAAFTLICMAGLTLVEQAIRKLRRTRPASNGLSNERLSPKALDFLAQGRKIDAIRVHREETGLNLREAKEAVDKAQRNLTPALSLSKERGPE